MQRPRLAFFVFVLMAIAGIASLIGALNVGSNVAAVILAAIGAPLLVIGASGIGLWYLDRP